MKTIKESGMQFGNFPDDDFFHIEKSKTYIKIQEHVKIVEFLLVRGKKIYIVEAKTNARKISDANFNEEILNLKDKFINSFSIALASILQLHPETYGEVPKNFKNIKLSEYRVFFTLVIKNIEKDERAPIMEKLQCCLNTMLKCWGYSNFSIIVLSEENAKNRNLVI